MRSDLKVWRLDWGGDAGAEYIGTGAEDHAVSRRKVRGKVADRAGGRAQPRPTRLGRTEKASSASRVAPRACPCAPASEASRVKLHARPPPSLSAEPIRLVGIVVSSSSGRGGAALGQWWGRALATRFVWEADGWTAAWRGVSAWRRRLGHPAVYTRVPCSARLCSGRRRLFRTGGAVHSVHAL
jgi:hypothetical protein